MPPNFISAKPDHFEHKSEEKMWNLLHDALGPDWTIIFNQYIEQSNSKGRRRGIQNQIDYVLLHPDKGVFILDAKGGQWQIDDDGNWLAGHERRNNIPEQANHQCGNFLRMVREWVPTFRSSQLRWIVGFVDCEPPELDVVSKDQFLGLVELKSLEEYLGKLFKTYGMESVGAGAVSTICAKAKPAIPLLRTVAAAAGRDAIDLINRESVSYVEASQSQIFAWRQLQSKSRLSIIGGAGTGKSLIAARMATTFSELGPNIAVLFVVHRKSAAANTRVLLDIPIVPLTLERFNTERIVVATESEIDRMVLSSGFVSTSDDPYEDYFLRSDRLFDLLIIDEAQEFDQSTIQRLQYLLRDPDTSPVYLFADPFQFSGKSSRRLHQHRPSSISFDQSISPKNTENRTATCFENGSNFDDLEVSTNWVNSRRFYLDWPEDFAHSMTLTKNHRNSEIIGDFAYNFQPHERPEFVVRQGVLNEFIVEPEFDNSKRMEGLIVKAVNQLLGSTGGFLPCEVLVADIGTFRKGYSNTSVGWTFVDPDEILRFPLTRADRRVVRGDADRVQGLQAPAVIVVLHVEIGAGDIYEEDVKILRDIYVSCSRAMSYLTVISRYQENELYDFRQLVPQQDGTLPSLAREWFSEGYLRDDFGASRDE